MPTPSRFPDGFLWGTATSSFQVEGAADVDGKGESIWDRFERVPGRIRNGDSLATSIDHYHRYREDIALLADLGVQFYRFSVSWPRVIPDGAGPVNERGAAFYADVVAELRKRGIRPYLMLCHWDIPQALQDRGGWMNPASPEWFERYARAMFARFGDAVDWWGTFNEPVVMAHYGYGNGLVAPGVVDPQGMLDAAHHILLAHGRAVRAFRAMGLPGRIGLGVNDNHAVPATDRPADRDAARALSEMNVEWYLDPIFRGEYPAFSRARFEARGLRVPGRDMDQLRTPTDFVTLNYYRAHRVEADPSNPCSGARDRPAPRGTTPFDDEGVNYVHPEGLYELLMRVHRRYGVPLQVGENGCPWPDAPAVDGEVRDVGRMDYLYRHLAQTHRAITDGAAVEGYTVWSMFDNFELMKGYAHRFGLTYVDYATQARRLKHSAHWYARVIRANALAPYAE